MIIVAKKNGMLNINDCAHQKVRAGEKVWVEDLPYMRIDIDGDYRAYETWKEYNDEKT